MNLKFDTYEIELVNESSYGKEKLTHTGFVYDLVYDAQESTYYLSTKHGVRLYQNRELVKSALLCSVGGATGIHEKSALVVNEDLLVCCTNKIFSLRLPNLGLNWVSEADPATCFGIYKNDVGLFVHGELEVSRIDRQGNIIWSVGFADITTTPEGKDTFVICEDFIKVTDFNYCKYKVDFDGNSSRIS